MAIAFGTAANVKTGMAAFGSQRVTIAPEVKVLGNAGGAFDAADHFLSRNPGKHLAGWRLYYSDRIVDSRHISWQKAKSCDVQMLIVFFEETYPIWIDDHWEQHNYRDMYFDKDYYWQFGNGQAGDVPAGASVKLGKEVAQADWRRIYATAWKDVTF